MRPLSTNLLALALLGSSLAAQIPQIPPAITLFGSATTTAPLPFPPLGPAGLGLTGAGTSTVAQIELRRIGSGTTFRLAMAAGGVPASFGGVAGLDVIEGTFDVATNTATLTSLAVGFNSAGDERTFSISEDGLVAVSSGAAQSWSSRASTGSVFPAAQAIAGISTALAADLKLFTQGTQLKLAWVDNTGQGKFAGNVWVGDFNNGVVSNAAIAIPLNTVPRLGVHSPHPVTQEIPAGSGTWVLLGWHLSGQWNALDCDSFWLPGADPTLALVEPPQGQLIWNEGGDQHHGTTFGASGSSVVIWNQSNDPISLPMVAMNGATFSSAAGGTAHLRVMVPANNDLWITAIFMGLANNPPIPLAFAIGNPLGQTGVPPGLLGVTPIITLQAAVPPFAGGTTFSIPLAAGSVPAGAPVPLQAVAINFTNGNVYLGNTAALEGL